MTHDGFEFDFRQTEEFDFRGSAFGEPDQPAPPIGPGGSGTEPFPTPDCEQPPAIRKPTAEEGGGRAPATWSPNWCATMIMGEITLVGELLSDGTNTSPMSGMFEGGTIGGPLPPGLDVGFTYPVSIHLVRASEHLRINPMQVLDPPEDFEFSTEPAPHLEACTFHIGRYALRSDGFVHVVHCSQPRPGVSEQRIGFGEPFIHREGLFSDPQIAALMEGWEGFKAYLAAYQTPFVQESSLRSFVPVCGTPF